MAVSVGDIFVSLGFKVDDKQLKDFDGGVRNLTGNMLATAGAIAAAAFGLERFVSGSAKAGTKLSNISEQTGISTTELQKLAVAANAANTALSVDSALNGLVNLRKALYDISIGKGNNSGWQILGIDPNGKTPTELIQELAQATHGMDRARANDLLDQIGLGKDYLRLLENIYNNPDFINKSTDGRIISEKDVAVLAEADKNLNSMWKYIELIQAEVTAGLFKGAQGNPEYENHRIREVIDWPKNIWNGLIKPNLNIDEINGPSNFVKPEDGYLFPMFNNFLDKLSQQDAKKFNEPIGDTNVNIVVNGAEDPQQTATVIQEYIQTAQDQRARSMK